MKYTLLMIPDSIEGITKLANSFSEFLSSLSESSDEVLIGGLAMTNYSQMSDVQECL